MYYVYLLESLTEEKSYYLGSTNDLRRRFDEHNSGNGCQTTKGKKWKLIYYEAYQTLELARERERKLKNHRCSKRALYNRLGI